MIEPYIFTLLASLFIITFQFARLWSLRRSPGAVELLLCSLACDFWIVGYLFEISLPGIADKLFWAKFQYLGIATISVWVLLFFLRYTGRATRMNYRHFAALFIIPILTILIVFTNEIHQWMWTSTTLQTGWPAAPLTLGHGWWFWVNIGYAYLLLVGATVNLVQFISNTQKRYLPQLFTMLAAMLAPWIGNALYILGFRPGPNLDLTPIAFALTNVGLAVAFVRFQLLDILPVAYSSIFAFMSDGVIVLDMQHRIIDINPAAREIFNRLNLTLPKQPVKQTSSNDPLIGLGLNDLLPDWLDAINSEKELVSNQGSEHFRVYSLRATPILDKREQITGHVILFTDITNLRRVEELARLQALALESAENAIVISDPQGCIEWVNPAFTRLTGYERKEALGETLRILKSGKHTAEQYQSLWATITAGKVWRGEMINRRKDGSFYDEEMTITPLVPPDGTITHYIAIKQDISDRKQAVEALKQAHKQAVESNRLKTQLLANVSHDMRTPLSAIIGFTEMLQANIYGEVPPEQKTVITDIQDSANQLLLFINNLIGQAQFDTGKIILKPKFFSVQELVDACQASMSFSASRKGLRLEYEINPPLDQPLFGDPYWLRQILINLVNNAVKFTHQGVVKIHMFSLDPEHWTIEVMDTGIGIPQEVQESIFEPFKQVDGSITRERSGSGLGLAIVKELTNLMDGQINLVSWPGVGSTFTISFPYKVEEKLL